MKYDFQQTRKDLFDADFVIVRNGVQIGQVVIRDWTLATTGVIQGIFAGKQFSLKRDPRLVNVLTPHDPEYRFMITIGGENKGSVCHAELKRGLFRRISYDQMFLFGKQYQRYGIGLGKDGNCSPIYAENRQIAQFSIDSEVIDERFQFHCAALNEDFGFAALFFICYSYISTCYRPGEKVYKHIRKTYSKTTDSYELSFYDPGFITRIEE